MWYNNVSVAESLVSCGPQGNAGEKELITCVHRCRNKKNTSNIVVYSLKPVLGANRQVPVIFVMHPSRLLQHPGRVDRTRQAGGKSSEVILRMQGGDRAEHISKQKQKTVDLDNVRSGKTWEN